MFIITCGLPKCGKSTLCKYIKAACKLLGTNIHIVNIEQFLPEDYDKLSAEDKSVINVAAWQQAVKYCAGLLLIQKCVIFDTCGSAPYSLTQLTCTARFHGHEVWSLIFDVDAEVCYKRCDNKIIDEYIPKIESAIKFYNKASDRTYTVINGDLTSYKKQAVRLARRIHGLVA